MKTININKEKARLREKKFYSEFKETIKYLPRDEMDLILDNIKLTDNKNRRRNYLMFRMLLSSGCRIGEFSLIKYNDINFKDNIITIPKENTKTNKSRVIRINNELFLDLKEFLRDNNIKNGYIFRNLKNKPLTPRNYNYLLDKYTKDLNLSFKPSVHTFRHSHIVYALASKVPLPAIMKQVGHLRITTTQIYADVAGTEVKEMYSNVNF